MVYKLEGLAELNKTIVKLRENLSKEKVAEVLDPPAEMLKNEIVARAPMKTGALKRGIVKKIYADYAAAVALVAIDYKIAPHAHLLEYGTVKMAPHPYFRPAWDALRGQITNDIVSGLTNLTNEAIEQGGK